MSILDAEQSARYIDSLVASVQALEADLAATRDRLRQAEARGGAMATGLSQRNIPALIEALRIRALALTGEAWERNATRDMMKEAAQQLEQAQARIAALEAQIADGMKDLADGVLARAERAEARIAALEQGLRSIAANSCCDRCQEAVLVAKSTLAQADARGREKER